MPPDLVGRGDEPSRPRPSSGCRFVQNFADAPAACARSARCAGQPNARYCHPPPPLRPPPSVCMPPGAGFRQPAAVVPARHPAGSSPSAKPTPVRLRRGCQRAASARRYPSAPAALRRKLASRSAAPGNRSPDCASVLRIRGCVRPVLRRDYGRRLHARSKISTRGFVDSARAAGPASAIVPARRLKKHRSARI